jgi:hypothetical protein
MSWITAEELAAETSTDRVVRLALKAGQRAGELERVKAENARLRELCERNGIEVEP